MRPTNFNWPTKMEGESTLPLLEVSNCNVGDSVHGDALVTIPTRPSRALRLHCLLLIVTVSVESHVDLQEK